MQQSLNPIDKAALGLSGLLVVFGTVVFGIVEILAGKPYSPAPLEETNEAGEVVNTVAPAVDPTLRTGLIILALVILLLWGVYRMASTAAEDRQTRTTEVATD